MFEEVWGMNEALCRQCSCYGNHIKFQVASSNTLFLKEK